MFADFAQPRFATAHLSTGPRIHYAEQGDPRGEALIFLHGYSDSWHSFGDILRLLPPRYHAFAYDQRGHGDSERPTYGYNLDDFARDVVAFMDAVGLARATLVGHSMGSFVARRVAASHPERVARLVLMGSTLTAINEVTLSLQEAVWNLDDPVPADFVQDFQASTIYAPVPADFFEEAVAESLKLPARVWQGALSTTLLAAEVEELWRIMAPTLILWGEEDAIFPHKEQTRLAAAIPGAKLKTYPATGHALHWERPHWVIADLDAFMHQARPLEVRQLVTVA